MKITNFELDITPPVGICIAGYGAHDETWEIHDPLMATGLLMDDGSRRAALLSFDLIGMDGAMIRKIRQGCAEILQTDEASIILSCTHTHGGPQTRTNYRTSPLQPYCDELVGKVMNACRKAADGEWRETSVYFYSAAARVNINRRYCGPENVCRFLPHWRSLEPLADGITDSEVGMLFFRDVQTRVPIEIVINYAAHPLASHARGLGGHAVTADYPGLIRKLVYENTRAHCTFVTGAAGDQFPIDSEIGWQNLDTTAKPIVREAMRGMCDAFVFPEKYQLQDPQIKSRIVPFRPNILESFPDERRRPSQKDKKQYDLELQLLSIGDICLVGVPGELVGELGLEIKWHSPFRKAFILYNSTDYISYICHANALVSGGYEANMQQIEYKAGLHLVNTAVDAMFEMHDQKIDIPEFTR